MSGNDCFNWYVLLHDYCYDTGTAHFRLWSKPILHWQLSSANTAGVLAGRRTRNSAERGGTPNALFTCGLVVSQRVCSRLALLLRTALYCIWNCALVQQIKAICKQIKVKLTASKQCVRHLAFCAYLPLPGQTQNVKKTLNINVNFSLTTDLTQNYRYWKAYYTFVAWIRVHGLQFLC